MINIKAYKDQNFELLEEKYSSTRLFIDPEFPACLHSITHTGEFALANADGDNILKYIEWRRPHEIVDTPHFVIDGFQRRDIGQGQLGNCWFLAAAGALTLNAELMALVIPYDQTFDASEYTGMFHFRFWLFGEWNDVVIDDRLPCYKGNFVFCRNNKDPNELWAPLLEKAYAKVCGSYKLMAGGRIADGLVDFTGGIDESIMLDQQSSPPEFKEEIKRLLCQALARKSMVGCAIFPTKEEPNTGLLHNGLVSGHAFSITQMKDLIIQTGVVTLIRCLNPWNDSIEWNGDWGDNSPLWDGVAEEEKRKFKFHRLHDGEFWMSYDDFSTNFHELQICHRTPESVGLFETASSTSQSCPEDKLTWHEEMFHGKWKEGESVGGSGLGREPPEKYWTNPQYLIKLEFTDDGIEEKWRTMIIALMFKGKQRKLNGEQPVYIGFDIYQVKNDANLRKHIEGSQKYYMVDLDYVGDSGKYTPYRSVSKRFKVRPGTYIIIPNTFVCDDVGEYLLRIFTEQVEGQTLAMELTNNKENLTELETKRPHVEVDSKSTSTPESSNEETNNATEGIGGAFPGPNSRKPITYIDTNNKEGHYCTIQ